MSSEEAIQSDSTVDHKSSAIEMNALNNPNSSFVGIESKNSKKRKLKILIGSATVIGLITIGIFLLAFYTL